MTVFMKKYILVSVIAIFALSFSQSALFALSSSVNNIYSVWAEDEFTNENGDPVPFVVLSLYMNQCVEDATGLTELERLNVAQDDERVFLVNKNMQNLHLGWVAYDDTLREWPNSLKQEITQAGLEVAKLWPDFYASRKEDENTKEYKKIQKQMLDATIKWMHLLIKNGEEVFASFEQSERENLKESYFEEQNLPSQLAYSVIEQSLALD